MEEENKSCSNSSRGIRMTRGLCYIIFPSNKTISFGNVSRNNWIEKKGDSCVGPVTHFRRDKRLPDTGETGSSLCPEAKSRRVRKTLTPDDFIEENTKNLEGGRREKKAKVQLVISACCSLHFTWWPTFFIRWSISSWKLARDEKQITRVAQGEREGESRCESESFGFAALDKRARDHMVFSYCNLFFFSLSSSFRRKQKGKLYNTNTEHSHYLLLVSYRIEGKLLKRLVVIQPLLFLNFSTCVNWRVGSNGFVILFS